MIAGIKDRTEHDLVIVLDGEEEEQILKVIKAADKNTLYGNKIVEMRIITDGDLGGYGHYFKVIRVAKLT